MRKFTAGQALSERRFTLCSHKLPKREAAALRRFDFYCFKCFVSYFLEEKIQMWFLQNVIKQHDGRPALQRKTKLIKGTVVNTIKPMV